MVFSAGRRMSWSLFLDSSGNKRFPPFRPPTPCLHPSLCSPLCWVCSQTSPVSPLPFPLCQAVGSSRADSSFAFPLAQSLPQRILGVGLFTHQTLTWTPGGLGETWWELSSELCPAAGPRARMRLYHFPIPKIPRPLRRPPESGSSWFSGFLGVIFNTGEFQRRLRDTWKSFTSAFLFLMWVSCWASSPFPGETCPKTYPQWMSHFVQYFLCVWSSSCRGMVIQYHKYFWT